MTRRRRPPARLVLVAVVLCALLAGSCSDDDGGDEEGSRSASSVAPTTEPRVRAPERSPGCAAGAPQPVRDQRREISSDGEARWYLVTAPAAPAGEPLPLVLDIHGLAEGATVHARMTAFADLAEREGFVVVMPNGTGQPVQWDTRVAGPNKDVAFIGRLLDTLERDLCIDTTRVYATGLSMGAMMSSVLACVMDERLAAIAPVAGVMSPEPCAAERPMPVLAFHGTADRILQFNGGVGPGLGEALGGGGSSSSAPTTTAPADLKGPGYPAAVAAWAGRNRCRPEAVDERRTAQIVHRTYDCPAAGAVEFFVVEGGGHTWPGSQFSKAIESIVGPTTFDVDATSEIWAFFSRFRLGG